MPTAFNFLGPLTNPARPFAQAVGCSDARMLPLMAEVLARRGTRAKLFRGDDGLDELTTTGLSTVYEVRDGTGPRDPPRPGRRSASPAPPSTTSAAATPRTSASIARSILAGEPGPKRDVVLLNAAATLEVAEQVPTLADGLALARPASTPAPPSQTGHLDRSQQPLRGEDGTRVTGVWHLGEGSAARVDERSYSASSGAEMSATSCPRAARGEPRPPRRDPRPPPCTIVAR